jgi:hypothetical protein
MHTIASTCLVTLALLQVAPRAVAAEKPAMPKEGIVFTVNQRERVPLPGLADEVFVKLGDISGGRVIIEVVAPKEGDGYYAQFRSVLAPLLMKRGDMRTFTHAGGEYRLTLVSLSTRLIGTDMANLKIEQVKAPEGKAPKPEKKSRKPGKNEA